MARCAALVELRDRRAAEQNVTTADLNLGPVTRLRVSDEELCRVGEVFALDSVTNSIIYGVPMRHLSLIVDEVIDRRAAEREQAAQSVPEKPTWEEAVKRRDAEREQAADGRERWQDQPMVEITADSSMLDKQIAMLQAKKIMGFSDQPWATTCAPKAEQAAPEPRKPAKWERRLDRMSGGLHFNYSGGEGWYASWMIDGGVVKYAYGDTPKAAVEAAWKAWKEERGE
jgi:hypothetical protein